MKRGLIIKAIYTYILNVDISLRTRLHELDAVL